MASLETENLLRQAEALEERYEQSKQEREAFLREIERPLATLRQIANLSRHDRRAGR